MSRVTTKQHNDFATSMDPDPPAHPGSLIRIHSVRFTNPITSRETNSEQHGSLLDCADAGRKPIMLVLSCRGSYIYCLKSKTTTVILIINHSNL
jgi:hypothetical protein